MFQLRASWKKEQSLNSDSPLGWVGRGEEMSEEEFCVHDYVEIEDDVNESEDIIMCLICGLTDYKYSKAL